MTRLAAVFAALLLAAPTVARAAPLHDISVRIDPKARSLEGRDTIRLDRPGPATLVLSARFAVHSVRVDGKDVSVPAPGRASQQRIVLESARKIDIHWSGTLAALDRGADRRDGPGFRTPAGGPEGTYLPAGSGWYPAVEGVLERYRLALELPAGQKGLVAGRLVEENESQGGYRARFEFMQPAEGIALMAGPYRVEERRVRTAAGTGVRLRTYFHAEVAGLARGYLDSATAYLDLYEPWIGAYPFSEFSIVSSPAPAGLGMPTLTYLGIEVLRLPFIRSTSLGHEVLHNWWGNGVYPDYASGNWSEGLTTFMADYAYREREGDAAGVRLAWLRDYAAMPTASDAAVARFTSRTHGASQVIGYGKAAMFFFMLRDAVGGPAFDEGLRRFWRGHRFRTASWADLRGAFEAASGRSLAAFFDQWLERTGAPALRIENARAIPTPDGWRVEVTLAQGKPAYALSVPLDIRTESGGTARRVDLTRERDTVSLELAAQPLAVALDPEFRLFRRMAPSEAPPILREALLAASPMMFVLSAEAGMQRGAQELAARLFDATGAGPSATPVTVVVGTHADVDEWLASAGLQARPPELAAMRGTAQVWTVRAGDGRTIVLVSARDAPSLAALAHPLPHHGRQSWLVFDGAHAMARGIWPAQPQVWELRPPVR